MPVVSVETPGGLYSLGVTRRTIRMAIEIDPVCGMQVDTETTDLKFAHDGTTYWFCGKGCLLEFRDDPGKYLDPDYQPSM
jgi:YHS domain-containing protein